MSWERDLMRRQAVLNSVRRAEDANAAALAAIRESEDRAAARKQLVTVVQRVLELDGLNPILVKALHTVLEMSKPDIR